jgi:serine/threonine protein kinase
MEDLPTASLSHLTAFLLKISDMGLSKQLEVDEHSFSSHFLPQAPHHQQNSSRHESRDRHNHPHSVQSVVGTIGWQAPELIHYQRGTGAGEKSESTTVETVSSPSNNPNHSHKTFNVDVFSLGCVFYYILTLGEHPFGKWYEREANIMKGQANLQVLESFPDAMDLISSMIEIDPLKRPRSSILLNHPFFWPVAKRLEFLTEFSDRIEKESPDSPVVLQLEKLSLGKWEKKLDSELIEDVGKFRKYDTSSVRDLLRLIRNKKHHFHELSPELKASIGSVPQGFFQYFDSRFPKLFFWCTTVSARYLNGNNGFITRWWEENNHYNLSGSQMISDNRGSEKKSEFLRDQLLFNPDLDDIDSSQQEPISPLYPPLKGGKFEGGDADESLNNVVVWNDSSLQSTLHCKGWSRGKDDWVNNNRGAKGPARKAKASHLVKSATDMKYRTRLCTHWESTFGSHCPMKKKGKCIFAHGPLELRVQGNKKEKWGKNNNQQQQQQQQNMTPEEFLRVSGGEDILYGARSIEKIRNVEGSYSEFERSTNFQNVMSPNAMMNVGGGVGGGIPSGYYYPPVDMNGYMYPPAPHSAAANDYQYMQEQQQQQHHQQHQYYQQQQQQAEDYYYVSR